MLQAEANGLSTSTTYVLYIPNNRKQIVLLIKPWILAHHNQHNMLPVLLLLHVHVCNSQLQVDSRHMHMYIRFQR